MTIGTRIKLRREELGLSQDDLSRRLGYKNRSSINKIEQDKQNLRQSKIKAIADALETTPDYIMGWDKKEETEKDWLTERVHQATLNNEKLVFVTQEEKDFLYSFRELDEDAQRQLILMLAFFKSQNGDKP